MLLTWKEKKKKIFKLNMHTFFSRVSDLEFKFQTLCAVGYTGHMIHRLIWFHLSEFEGTYQRTEMIMAVWSRTQSCKTNEVIAVPCSTSKPASILHGSDGWLLHYGSRDVLWATLHGLAHMLLFFLKKLRKCAGTEGWITQVEI